MRDPAFLFYPSDFLMGVSDLTMEERGQYITLMCLQHQKGHLSEKTIRLSLGFDLVSSNSDVLEKFEIDEDGNYFNERLDNEIQKRSKTAESHRAVGKLGGRPPKEDNQMDNLMVNQTETKRLLKQEPNHNLTVNVNRNTNNGGAGGNDVTLFNQFWLSYPKKLAKKDALKAWGKLSLANGLFEQITVSLEKWKKSKDWLKDGGQYIPNAATWLNGERWNDEIPGATQIAEPKQTGAGSWKIT